MGKGIGEIAPRLHRLGSQKGLQIVQIGLNAVDGGFRQAVP